MSGAEHRIAVTLFANHAAKSKHEETYTLGALATRILAVTAATKSKLPWLKLARFGSATTAKGSLRHDANVLACSGLEGDYDKATIPFEAVCDRLQQAGVLSLVYTSPSYTVNTPKCRILCPFSAEMPPERRAVMLGRLAGLLHGIGAELAGESWTLSQSYYFGSVKHNPDHRARVIEGTPIDLHDELDHIRIDKPGDARGNGKDRTLRPIAATDPADISDARLDGLLRSLLARLGEAREGEKHPTLLRIARTIGGYAHLFGLSDDHLVAAILDALPRTVRDWTAAEKTARDGLRHGRAEPLGLEERPRRRMHAP